MLFQTKFVAKCRICGSNSLRDILDFGNMHLTGVFLDDGAMVPEAPLKLVQCNSCFLVQLGNNYSQEFLYGETYGYESHLNKSMVQHLTRKARQLESRYLSSIKSPVVVDIASNDGTMLSGYTNQASKLVGIDPIAQNLANCYPKNVTIINNFFSADEFFARIDEKANLVTSLSVLYDLDNPLQFISNIYEILAEGGVWHFEQSYMPLMVETSSYDTICHEHLLYLSMHDIVNLCKKAGFQIASASLNSINGGSIAVTAVKSTKKIQNDPYVEFLLQEEKDLGYQSSTRIIEFADKARIHKDKLSALVADYLKQDNAIFALGASTKGNVLLQWLQFDHSKILKIGDINPKKFGKETPGTKIPIQDEGEVLSQFGESSVGIVLPWHFREGIIQNCSDYLSKGGRLLFPLPAIQIVSN